MNPFEINYVAVKTYHSLKEYVLSAVFHARVLHHKVILCNGTMVTLLWLNLKKKILK